VRCFREISGPKGKETGRRKRVPAKVSLFRGSLRVCRAASKKRGEERTLAQKRGRGGGRPIQNARVHSPKMIQKGWTKGAVGPPTRGTGKQSIRRGGRENAEPYTN